LPVNRHIIASSPSKLIDGLGIGNNLMTVAETIARMLLAGKQAKTLSPAQIKTALSY